VDQKGKGEKVELKIEVVSPIAQELNLTRIGCEEFEKGGSAYAQRTHSHLFESQRMSGAKPSKNPVKTSGQGINRKID
jgi:hypothetical protein